VYNRGFCRVRLLNDARQIPPQSTPVAIATKFKTKLAITRLVYEISPRCSRLTGYFGVKLSRDISQIVTGQPQLPWQQNLRQNRLQLGLCTRYLGDLCVQHGVFLVGLLNDVTQLLPRPTLVAMVTKYETKSAV